MKKALKSLVSIERNIGVVEKAVYALPESNACAGALKRKLDDLRFAHNELLSLAYAALGEPGYGDVND